MHKYSFLLFLPVFLTIYISMHYYVYTGIAGGFMLSPNGRLFLKLFFLFGASSFFISEILMRQTSAVWLRPVAAAGTVWIGVISIALTVFLLRGAVSLFFHGTQFRFQSTAASCLAIVLLSSFSVVNAARGWTIRTITMHVPGLPPEADGFSIVQLSDIHINALTSPDMVERMVKDANTLSPDLMVITGDLIDADICRFPRFCSALSGLSAPRGVYAISGNHEAYVGMDIFQRVCRETGIQIIDNRSILLPNGMILAGISDDISTLGSKAGPFIEKALATSAPDTSAPSILLSHRPDTFDAAVKAGVKVQLSGHTHAGQIPPIDLLTLFFFKYPKGLYHSNDASLYVTTGTVYWGPPMRLFSRSEMVKIVLKTK